MTMEEQFKAEILRNYKSIRAFTQAIGVPYSTIDSMLKKGICGTSMQTVLKACSALDLDVESLASGVLRHKTAIPAPSDPPPPLSEAAMTIARAYEQASKKEQNTIRTLLDLPPSTKDLLSQSNYETAAELMNFNISPALILKDKHFA